MIFGMGGMGQREGGDLTQNIFHCVHCFVESHFVRYILNGEDETT